MLTGTNSSYLKGSVKKIFYIACKQHAVKFVMRTSKSVIKKTIAINLDTV